MSGKSMVVCVRVATRRDISRRRTPLRVRYNFSGWGEGTVTNQLDLQRRFLPSPNNLSAIFGELSGNVKKTSLLHKSFDFSIYFPLKGVGSVYNTNKYMITT